MKKLINKFKRLSKRAKIIVSVVAVVLLLIIILGVLGLLNYRSAQNLYDEAIAGKTEFEAAQEKIMAQDFAGAGPHLDAAETHFLQAQEYSDELGELKIIPVVGRQLKAVDNILKAGFNIASALQKINTLGEDIFAIVQNDGDITYRNIDQEQKRAILQELYEAPPDLQGAKSEIDLAVLAMDQIPQTGILKSLKQAVQPLQEKLPLVKEVIDQVVPAVETLPTLAGYPEEKTYLFLLQNNSELRPTGGFIGTYGILKTKDGEISQFVTDNIYNLDNGAKETLFIDPPEPIKKYLSSTQWMMRDSNWSPDFPTTAAKTEEFYHLENGPEENIHGVIAVTPTFIGSLLELTGPITVEGVEFTSENLVDVLQYQVERAYAEQGISDADRKEIIGTLADELMDKILTLPKDEWGDLWKTFVKDVDEKQILIYLKDERIQELVVEQNWAGEIKSPEGDFAMVVDANMASLKTDPGVKRTIDYSVTKEGDDLIGNLSVRYKNEGYFGWKTTRYRTYTRIYVPQGAELIEHSGVMNNDKLIDGSPADPEVYDELNKTVFAGFIAIEPQAEATLHYKYKLPDHLKQALEENNYYKIYLQKQAGTPGHDLNVSMDVGQKVTSCFPLDICEKSDNNKVQFTSNLKVDRDLTVNF